MKATGIIAALAACLAFSASADVEALYWQVTAEENVNNVSFDYAALAAIDTSTHAVTRLADTSGGVLQKSNNDKLTTEVVYTEIGSQYQSGYSFYIELWNYNSESGNWTMAGISSQTYSYSDISAHIHSTSSMSMSTLSTFTPTVVVPEPTSGLLFVVGGALLALRRRRGADR